MSAILGRHDHVELRALEYERSPSEGVVRPLTSVIRLKGIHHKLEADLGEVDKPARAWGVRSSDLTRPCAPPSRPHNIPIPQPQSLNHTPRSLRPYSISHTHSHHLHSTACIDACVACGALKRMRSLRSFLRSFYPDGQVIDRGARDPMRCVRSDAGGGCAP